MISPTLIGVLAFVFLFGVVAFIGAPYVPSHKKYVRRAFEHFGFGEGDVLVDAGSGDGIVLRIASKQGMRAIGYDINPVLVLISKMLSLSDTKVTVLLQNLWAAKLPADTTIVYAFSVSRDEMKLIKLLQNEANRLQKPLKLLCYGSPFKSMQATDAFEAYHLYLFHPLQSKNA